MVVPGARWQPRKLLSLGASIRLTGGDRSRSGNSSAAEEWPASGCHALLWLRRRIWYAGSRLRYLPARLLCLHLLAQLLCLRRCLLRVRLGFVLGHHISCRTSVRFDDYRLAIGAGLGEIVPETGL